MDRITLGSQSARDSDAIGLYFHGARPRQRGMTGRYINRCFCSNWTDLGKHPTPILIGLDVFLIDLIAGTASPGTPLNLSTQQQHHGSDMKPLPAGNPSVDVTVAEIRNIPTTCAHTRVTEIVPRPSNAWHHWHGTGTACHEQHAPRIWAVQGRTSRGEGRSGRGEVYV